MPDNGVPFDRVSRELVLPVDETLDKLALETLASAGGDVLL